MFETSYSPKRLIICLFKVLILAVIYVVSLSADSGPIGGFIFIFIALLFIPTAIFFIIAYYLSFELFSKKNKLVKSILFILFSFVLCLNTKILYVLNIRSYQPVNFQVQVIKPLQKPIADVKNFAIESDFKSDIKTSPLCYKKIGAGASDGFYFKNISMIKKITSQFTKADVIYSIGISRGDEYVVYISYNILKKADGVILEMSLKDKAGGFAKIQATYPNASFISNYVPHAPGQIFYHNTLNDLSLINTFLKQAFDTLLHDNIWNWVLMSNNWFETKTLYDLMNDQKKWSVLSE